MASSQKKLHRSIFQLPPYFFDHCRFLPSPPSQTLQPPSNHIDHIQNAVVSGSSLTCNTCKAQFDSFQDQRSHLKSDIHRFNVSETDNCWEKYREGRGF
ncbi:putative transcription factor C2H2 family [Medicago truncatula]|uniref:Putative transcription factor C2H2 family n=1 Tax=Medicago truncatula TaxID=3880 RepID=A0A396H0A0_MEDTR|nr:putative transcription factor C2H2 family [Medicago truncatula]